ncbi:MAG: hypothetical protein GXX96_07240 [Planctomycetaceae bacterium]|nr:hypothetical protein [Planctomycetaceae bacterium]
MWDTHDFLATVAQPIGWLYAVAAGLDLIAAGRAVRKHPGKAAAWAMFAAAFVWEAARSFAGHPPLLPTWFKAAVDAALGPVTFTLGSFALLAVLFAGREFFVRTAVAWTALNLSLALFCLSLTDPNFAAIVAKGDNVPIVAMVFLLGYFTWLGARQAVENDRRNARGLPPAEKELGSPVLVWPDLVYIELICMVLVTAGLIAWSLLVRAPLEEPANPVVTPNPAKAPWYFLGLQEMLVFFDASIAGVLFPCLIILGLCAIPYLDVNPRGNGYYTIAERKFAYLVFQFGFLQLWIFLILVGTFLRGPGWAFFGPFEPHDPSKVEALSNISLSRCVWDLWLGVGMPRPDPATGFPGQLATVVWRESVGLTILVLYFVGLPAILARTWLASYRLAMGRTRYWIMILLLLMMLMLPIKMFLRWTFGLSFLVSIPEYSLNF